MVTARLRQDPKGLLQDALADIAEETRHSLRTARSLTRRAELPDDVREGVLDIVRSMEDNLAAQGL